MRTVSKRTARRIIAFYRRFEMLARDELATVRDPEMQAGCRGVIRRCRYVITRYQRLGGLS